MRRLAIARSFWTAATLLLGCGGGTLTDANGGSNGSVQTGAGGAVITGDPGSGGVSGDAGSGGVSGNAGSAGVSGDVGSAGVSGNAGRGGAGGGSARGGTGGSFILDGVAGSIVPTGRGGQTYDCGVAPADAGVANADAGNGTTPQPLPALGLRAPLAYRHATWDPTALGDVTGDGFADLVSLSQRLTLRSNDGSGRFVGPVDIGPGLPPPDLGGQDDFARAILAADLNGDGYADLVYVHNFRVSLGVRLNDGAGGFEDAVEYPIQFGFGFAIGDLDGDGDVDIVTATDGQDSEVDVLINAGDGSFAPAVVYPTGASGGATAIALGDLDGDGRDDLVGVGQNEDVLVFWNRGDGRLLAPVSFAAGPVPNSLAIGDVDGDGKADLAVVNYLDGSGPVPPAPGGASTVSILRNRGNGSFAAPVAYAVGLLPWGVVLADLNGDRTLDLAVRNDADASALYNRGDGTFAPAVGLGVGGELLYVLAGEVNGDGKTDLLFTNFAGDLVVGLSGANGALDVGSEYPTGPWPDAQASAPATPAAIASGDLDGDGKLDLVATGTAPGDSGMKLLLNRGAGTFGAPVALNVASATSTATLAIADLNRDGLADLVSGDSVPCVYLNTGAGKLDAGLCYGQGSDPSSRLAIAVGDVNNDGSPDLVLVRRASTRTLLNDGAGRFAASMPFSVGADATSAVLADVDGDGRLDLVFAEAGSAGNTGGIYVEYGAGDGRFGAGPILAAGSSPRSIAVADLDGDGRPDIAVGNIWNSSCGGAQGTLDVLFADGQGGFKAPVRYGGGGYATVAASDIDGDGDTDLVALEQSRQDLPGAQMNLVTLFVNDGGGRFTRPLQYATAATATSMTLGDLNGDGRPDIAVASNRGVASVLLNGPR